MHATKAATASKMLPQNGSGLLPCVSALLWYNRSRTWTESDISSIRWFLHDACHTKHKHEELKGNVDLLAGESVETNAQEGAFLKKGG